MIPALLTGCILGVLVAIPPGPVMVVIVRGALNSGRQYAMKIAYGIAILDIIYSFVFSLATGKISFYATTLSERYPHLVVLFQLACIIGLIVYGVYSIRSTLYKVTSHPRTTDIASKQPCSLSPADTNVGASPVLPAFMSTLAKHGPFFLGLALALTHLANPTFVPLMTGVSYAAGHYGFLQEGALWQHVSFAFGYAGGVLAWLMLLVSISLRYRHVFSDTLMLKINRLLGVTMIGVGTYWGFHRFELVLWALRDLLKLGFAL